MVSELKENKKKKGNEIDARNIRDAGSRTLALNWLKLVETGLQSAVILGLASTTYVGMIDEVETRALCGYVKRGWDPREIETSVGKVVCGLQRRPSGHLWRPFVLKTLFRTCRTHVQRSWDTKSSF